MRKLYFVIVGGLLLAGCGGGEEAGSERPSGSVLFWVDTSYANAILVPEEDPGGVSASVNGQAPDSVQYFPGYVSFSWDAASWHGTASAELSTENLGDISGSLAFPGETRVFPEDSSIQPGQDLVVSWTGAADFYLLWVYVEDSAYNTVYEVDTFLQDTQFTVPGSSIPDNGFVVVSVVPINGPWPYAPEANMSGDNPNFFGYLYTMGPEVQKGYFTSRRPLGKIPSPGSSAFERVRRLLGM